MTYIERDQMVETWHRQNGWEITYRERQDGWEMTYRERAKMKIIRNDLQGQRQDGGEMTYRERGGGRVRERRWLTYRERERETDRQTEKMVCK